MSFSNFTFKQGETTLAQVAEIYFENSAAFTQWMSQKRPEFGDKSGFEFQVSNPSIALGAIAGQIALSTGGPVKKLEISAP